MQDALLILIILHLLVYPASNGYNSYMDRDETSIGGIKNPLQPTRQLYYTTITLDILAIALSFLIGIYFTIGLAAYIIASRLYSYRGIRLKQYPVAGYLVVVFFQGAVAFFLVYHGSSENKTLEVPVSGMLASSLLIGGFYPLTQVYQHESDKKDGVTTISMLLGYQGTFIFTAIVYSLAMGVLYFHFKRITLLKDFYILTTTMLPVLVYFFIWYFRVRDDTSQASYRNAMQMSLLASVCTNLAFIILLMRRFI